jgi:hypothetical protein
VVEGERAVVEGERAGGSENRRSVNSRHTANASYRLDVTVLIGFSCPEFTILGADGRSIAANDRNDVDDDTQKIFKTGIGVIAGAGRTDVIHAVTHRLENHAPASNQEASEIIRAEVEKLGLSQDDPGLERTWNGINILGASRNTRTSSFLKCPSCR